LLDFQFVDTRCRRHQRKRRNQALKVRHWI
jgi:hypothetical protein